MAWGRVGYMESKVSASMYLRATAGLLLFNGSRHTRHIEAVRGKHVRQAGASGVQHDGVVHIADVQHCPGYQGTCGRPCRLIGVQHAHQYRACCDVLCDLTAEDHLCIRAPQQAGGRRNNPRGGQNLIVCSHKAAKPFFRAPSVPYVIDKCTQEACGFPDHSRPRLAALVSIASMRRTWTTQLAGDSSKGLS